MDFLSTVASALGLGARHEYALGYSSPPHRIVVVGINHEQSSRYVDAGVAGCGSLVAA